ncbi:hypothetical protein LBMAG49_10380 [Planctomycetota bacterium]|nr:hypothetical protein LBMAG49_10380 [Planctomycetota bacterium]
MARFWQWVTLKVTAAEKAALQGRRWVCAKEGLNAVKVRTVFLQADSPIRSSLFAVGLCCRGRRKWTNWAVLRLHVGEIAAA